MTLPPEIALFVEVLGRDIGRVEEHKVTRRDERRDGVPVVAVEQRGLLEPLARRGHQPQFRQDVLPADAVAGPGGGKTVELRLEERGGRPDFLVRGAPDVLREIPAIVQDIRPAPQQLPVLPEELLAVDGKKNLRSSQWMKPLIIKGFRVRDLD